MTTAGPANHKAFISQTGDASGGLNPWQRLPGAHKSKPAKIKAPFRKRARDNNDNDRSGDERAASDNAKKRRVAAQTDAIPVAGPSLHCIRDEPALEQKRVPRPDHNSRLDELEVVGMLGRGAHGGVLLCKVKAKKCSRPGRPRLFAVKCQCKTKDMPALSERRILSKLPYSPFVTGLLDVFYDNKFVYYMMEYVPCGTLYRVSRGTRKSSLEAAEVQFYLANIVLGLEFLQKHGIVHCDLKPANILIGADGYLAITDFGLALHKSWGYWPVLGTCEYMPPEYFTETRFPTWDLAKGVDWWAVGCIAYELATGSIAFPRSVGCEDSRPASIVMKQDVGKLEWGGVQDRALAGLIQNMFSIRPETRIGYEGSEQVKAHRFFRGLDWEALADRDIHAPRLFAPVHSKKLDLPDDGALPGLSNAPRSVIEQLARDATLGPGGVA